MYESTNDGGGRYAEAMRCYVRAREVGALVEGQDGLVEGGGPRGAGRVDAADELGVAAQVREHPPGEHPLRGERDEEVLADAQTAAGLQRRHEPAAGRAHGQGGL